jgi:hypothetical protein
MKLHRILLSFIIATLLVSSCSGPRIIPDSTLINIFHDAFLANAYMAQENINEDSLYVYEPIFDKYGYTMEDLQHTIITINERKSAMLSDIMYEVNKRLEEESREESRKIIILDTIDNIARRTYTRTMYSDTLIRATSLRDSTKLRITLDSLVPGEYTVSFDYFIDTLDENRNSRIEAYLIIDDSTTAMRSSMMFSRYRDGKYSRKFSADTMHKQLYINMFYHPNNEEPKQPSITIRNFNIVRVLPTEQCVDSLYEHQLDIRILNYDLMMGFTRDSSAVMDINPTDTTTLVQQ